MILHVATRRPGVGLASVVPVFCVLLAVALPPRDACAADLPGVQEVFDSPRDLWGEASLKQPNGPSYEFFVPLLQPMRYTDAPFRHYPITLSAPGAVVKARYVSNGSAVNALARQTNWVGETGTPVTFRVTREMQLFGGDLARLEGPKYEGGYLPIVQTRYRAVAADTAGKVAEHVLAQEAFAAVDPELAKHGVVLVRFTLAEGPGGDGGLVEAQVEGTQARQAVKGVVSDRGGANPVVSYDERWEFRPGRATLRATLQPGQSAFLAIYTTTPDTPVKVDAGLYDAQRTRCADAWNELLARGMNVEVPEPVVNDAWRATTIGNFMLLSGDRMWYSQGNQYAKLYIGEGGDTTRAMAVYNHLDTARRIIPPLMVYTRPDVKFHQAGLKLQMLAHVYWLTRDAEFIRSIRLISDKGRRPGWQTELDLLLTGREETTGLFPPESYAGDIREPVYSANSNSNGWRGLRDFAVVLDEIGEKELAATAAASAEQFRKAVLAALDKSVDRSVQPPFVPLALFGAEKPYEAIYGKRLGSYWNIMSKFVLASGVFPPDSEYANALVDYARQRGGLCMGMNRTSADPDSWWISPRGINDLYTLRYTNVLLRRDEPDLALVGFYGKLAHGMTRDTFIGCEGSSILPMEGNGRQMYLPPNSAANANFLEPLRYLLVQDYDMNDDGRPETLRLAFATPRRWLEHGKQVKVERASTAFGEVSFTIRAALQDGTVTADVSLPQRSRPERTLLRLRLPGGARVASASIEGGRDLPVAQDGETLDLSEASGKVRVVARTAAPAARPQN